MLQGSITLPTPEERMFSRLTPAERGVYLENKKKQDAKGPPVSYAVMTEELVKIQEHCCGLYEKTNKRITEQGSDHDLEWNNLFARIKTLENLADRHAGERDELRGRAHKLEHNYDGIVRQLKPLEEMAEKGGRIHLMAALHIANIDNSIESLQEEKCSDRLNSLEKAFQALHTQIQEHIAHQNEVLVGMMKELLSVMFIHGKTSTATPPPTPQM